MKTRILPYDEAHEPAVKAMNARLKAGGSSWGFYDKAAPGWLGGASDIAARHYVLAVDGAGDVHGGMVLKTQLWQIGGEVVDVLNWQGPVSEALVDKAHAAVATKFLMHLRDRAMPLYGWGSSDQLTPLLAAMGMTHYPTPLLMKFVRPGRVARLAPFLRTSTARRRILDLAAATGLAAVGGWLGNAALRWRKGSRGPAATAVSEAGFGGWADTIWAAARPHYRAIAVRDQVALQRVTASWPGVQIHRIERGGATIGWAALLVTAMQGDKRFGDLKVGSIVDALSLSGEERATVAAAARVLQQQGVDLIAANLTHRRWLDAFAADAFVRFDGRRALYIADTMGEVLAGAGAAVPDDMHLMPIDGDGPLGL